MVRRRPPTPPAVKFTEEQALDWLAANPKTGKTIREIAAILGWSKTTAQRFVARFGTEPGTRRGTSLEQTTLSHGTDGTSDADAAGTPPVTERSGRVLGRTPSGAVVATMPYCDDFDWAHDESVVVPAQPAIAVYINSREQVVIRAEGGDYGEDSFVVISVEHLPKVIAKLTAILKEV
jgi:hypothetical protein